MAWTCGSSPGLLCRPKAAAGQELAKQQPFARSASTAAEVVKRRQALAELEMVPCTFHPALDPHSLALVAAKVKSCHTTFLSVKCASGMHHLHFKRFDGIILRKKARAYYSRTRGVAVIT